MTSRIRIDLKSQPAQFRLLYFYVDVAVPYLGRVSGCQLSPLLPRENGWYRYHFMVHIPPFCASAKR